MRTNYASDAGGCRDDSERKAQGSQSNEHIADVEIGV